MPVKFRNKSYVGGGIYHIYNRGLDGREIFSDEKDYALFLELVSRYVSVVAEKTEGMFKGDKPSVVERKKRMNLTDVVQVLAYCLMPDHFHLVVRQERERGITDLMRRVLTGYVMEYNRRHRRRGPLFESAYRAVLVEGEEKAAHVVRWVHLNPAVRSVVRLLGMETVSVSAPDTYPYSSYHLYLGNNMNDWVKRYFGKISPGEYKKWVENSKIDSKTVLGDLTID